jgi:hypothetical protein
MQENGQKQPLIVVLGMHRSGTSVLTRGLKVLDVALGENLMPEHEPTNPKGFFEDIDVNELNEELLCHLGLKWDSLCDLTSIDIQSLDLQDLSQRAKNLLTDKMKEATGVFAVKNPRLCILLPFWMPLFEELNLDVSYIIAHRHPTSVAHSLQKRDSFTLQKGYILWYRHMLSSLRETESQKRIVVSYDSLLENPESELKRISVFLKKDFDISSNSLNEYKEEFLDLSLRHNVQQDNLSDLFPHLTPSISELQEELVLLGKANPDAPSESKLLSYYEGSKKKNIELFGWQMRLERRLHTVQGYKKAR